MNLDNKSIGILSYSSNSIKEIRQMSEFLRYGERESDIFLFDEDKDTIRYKKYKILKKDPKNLTNWSDFLDTTESIPSDSPDYTYKRLRLYRRVLALWKRPEYYNDIRYVKIYLDFIKSKPSKDRPTQFKEMKDSKIGQETAIFYENYAEYEWHYGQMGNAIKILNEAINKGLINEDKKKYLIDFWSKTQFPSVKNSNNYVDLYKDHSNWTNSCSKSHNFENLNIKGYNKENWNPRLDKNTKMTPLNGSISNTKKPFHLTKYPNDNNRDIQTPSSAFTNKTDSSTQQSRLFTYSGSALRIPIMNERGNSCVENEKYIQQEAKTANDIDKRNPISSTYGIHNDYNVRSHKSLQARNELNIDRSTKSVEFNNNKEESYLRETNDCYNDVEKENIIAFSNDKHVPNISDRQTSGWPSNDIKMIRQNNIDTNENSIQRYKNKADMSLRNRSPPTDDSNNTSNSNGSNNSKNQYSLSPYCDSFITNKDIIVIEKKKYIKLNEIGRGGSSKVYRILSENYQIYALKRIKLNRSCSGDYENEINLLRKLQGSPYIIKLIATEFLIEKQIIHVVMEQGEIDLNTKLKQLSKDKGSQNPILDENFLRNIWEQMLMAVNTIHQQRIIHGDLKPANFLFVNGAIKLIDFGIAKAISNDTTNVTREQQVGTINFMSPEAISGGYTYNPNSTSRSHKDIKMKVSRSSDIWSLGCILYQIVYGFPPFSNAGNMIQKMQAIVNHEFIIRFPETKNNHLLDIMKKCLQRDISLRPTIDGDNGLLNHPFLRPSISLKNNYDNVLLSDENNIIKHPAVMKLMESVVKETIEISGYLHTNHLNVSNDRLAGSIINEIKNEIDNGKNKIELSFIMQKIKDYKKKKDLQKIQQ